MVNDLDRAHDALHFLDAGCDRETWHKIGRAAIAAGVTVDALDAWSSTAGNYAGTRDVQAAFRTIKADGGTGAGTLFLLARDAGWSEGDKRQQQPRIDYAAILKKKPEPPRQPAPGMSPADVWGRCEAATAQHPYIAQKQAAGVPLDGLRVLPAGDGLLIGGEPMAGSLVVPVNRADGSISSLQFIAPPDVAARLKAKGKPGKLNLPGCPVQGSFTVGELLPGGLAYIVEGIGAAWSCWQATGAAAVVCFGSGRMRAVAAELRQRDAAA
ncbi:PriCT-2 domain-containing protein, partial [Polaromonas sp. DSR2-3-2]|uniref:PriCT-2 domain-containing protein n=2 Tax=unclassified Polaromonas TaxID=2638319 RepID=UPI003CE97FE6